MFPFVLAIGAAVLFGIGIQSSIINYYHTGMGDVFTADRRVLPNRYR